MNNRGFSQLLLLVGILLLVLVTAVFFFNSQYTRESPDQNENIETKNNGVVLKQNNGKALLEEDREVIIDYGDSSVADWVTFYSEEFGISFKLPKSFYLTGARTNEYRGPYVTPYILGENVRAVEEYGTISCNLMSVFLKDPENCSDGDKYASITFYYDYATEHELPILDISTPSWVSFEDSIGCVECSFWYDDDVMILGKNYKVRVYYTETNEGKKFTQGIDIEGLVPAGQNSKWEYFGIRQFIWVNQVPQVPFESGLSETSREILKSIQYID